MYLKNKQNSDDLTNYLPDVQRNVTLQVVSMGLIIHIDLKFTDSNTISDANPSCSLT